MSHVTANIEHPNLILHTYTFLPSSSMVLAFSVIIITHFHRNRTCHEQVQQRQISIRSFTCQRSQSPCRPCLPPVAYGEKPLTTSPTPDRGYCLNIDFRPKSAPSTTESISVFVRKSNGRNTQKRQGSKPEDMDMSRMDIWYMHKCISSGQDIHLNQESPCRFEHLKEWSRRCARSENLAVLLVNILYSCRYGRVEELLACQFS